MADFFIRPKAREDMESIWVFTFETWGEDQADRYIYNLETGFKGLAENPETGKPCDDIRAGYRSYSIGKHIIFYKIIKKGIEIVRILHQRMDPTRHI